MLFTLHFQCVKVFFCSDQLSNFVSEGFQRNFPVVNRSKLSLAHILKQSGDDVLLELFFFLGALPLQVSLARIGKPDDLPPRSCRMLFGPIKSSEDSISEEDGQDIHIVDCPIEPEVRFKKAPTRKKKKITSEDESGASVEEGAFLAKIANLGQTINTDDESTAESEDLNE
jgi:hypothetical protein